MRIAVAGTHAVGKSTLLVELSRALGHHEIVDEPYYELMDEGHEFADVPAVDDFVAQLDHSIGRLSSERPPDVLYDRCPADFLAYLVALRAEAAIQDRLTRAREALATLDLVVFVPIEDPDRIESSDPEDRLRGKVDAILREMLVDDSYGLGVPVVEVHGSPLLRTQQLLAILQRPSRAGSSRE
jgi:hypothetical protein